MEEKKTSVLYVCEIGGDYGGNFLDSFTELAEKIEKGGGKCCFAFPARATQKGWYKKTAKRFPTFSYANNKELRAIVRECYSKYTIKNIHANFFTNRIGIAIWLATIGKSIKLIFHWHCQPYQCANTLSGKLRKLYLLTLYNLRKDTQIGVSAGVTKNLEEYFKRKNVITIANAISEKRLLREDKNASKIKNNKDVISITMTAGYSPMNKGLEIAVRAADILEAEKYKVRFYIPSTGDTVSNFVKEHFGSEGMRFIEIVRPSEGIAREYFGHTDIYLSPSYSEAFSYSVIEASYFGSQVIASKISGQGDIVLPHIYWIDDPNTNTMEHEAKQLAETILKAFRDRQKKDWLKQKTEEDRRIIQKEYNFDDWCERIIELYV